MTAAAESLPVAPAIFLGWQDGYGATPRYRLYNLTASIPGHPTGSTVGEQTLRDLGYAVADSCT